MKLVYDTTPKTVFWNIMTRYLKHYVKSNMHHAVSQLRKILDYRCGKYYLGYRTGTAWVLNKDILA